MKTLIGLLICGGILLAPVTSEARHHRRCCCQCGPVCTCGPSCACPGCAVHAKAAVAKPACGATCDRADLVIRIGPTMRDFDKLPGAPFKVPIKPVSEPKHKAK
jgi:hypothetical protein